MDIFDLFQKLNLKDVAFNTWKNIWVSMWEGNSLNGHDIWFRLLGKCSQMQWKESYLLWKSLNEGDEEWQ